MLLIRIYVVSTLMLPPARAADDAREPHRDDTLPSAMVELDARWRAMSQEVATARLQVRRITLRPGGSETPEALAAIEFVRREVVGHFDAGDSDAGSAIESVIERYRDDHSMTGSWTDVAVIADGTTLRNNVVYTGANGQEELDVRVRSHEGETHYRSSIHQATVRSSASAIAMTTLQDVRYTPTAIRPERFIRYEMLDDRLLKLELVQCDLTVDAATGLVEELQFYAGDRSHPLMAMLQSRRCLEDSGISFPQCTVRLNFREQRGVERLRSAEFNLVEFIGLNDEIPEADFEVNAPANTVIVELGADDEVRLARRTDEEAADVRERAVESRVADRHQNAMAVTESLPGGNGSRWSAWIILNVVVMVILAILYVRRRSRRGGNL